MNTVRHDGFTIIETMLFLAVSGALVIAILAASGIAISQQRYKDAAIGLESILQSQYANTSNVVNSRSDTLSCADDGSGNVRISPGVGSRGASECVVLGRYIKLIADGSGTNIITANVIGVRANPLDMTPVENDIDALKQYIMATSSIDEETTPVSWGAQVVKPVTNEQQNITILVLRSPLSGSLLTFVLTLADPDSKEIISSTLSAVNTKQTLCLSTNGFSAGQPIGIVVQSGAGGSSAIELVAEGSLC